MGMNSILTMDSFDELWWALAAYILIRLLKRDNPRLWLVFGLVAGLGLMTKITMAYFGAALVIGLLLTPARKYLGSKWLWLGGLIAFAFLVPYVIWQIKNGFPTLEFWKVYASGKTYPVTPLEFLLQQIIALNPLTLPLWLAGLGWYLVGKPYRMLGIAYIVLFVIFMLMQAKNYFLAPAYPMLFAAGALVIERFASQSRRNWLKPFYAACVLIVGALAAPMALPILPIEMFVQYARPLGGDAGLKSERLATADLPQHFADRFGWENLAETVARVYQSLPPDDQAQACIFAGNYGEAGAINFFGKARGLPAAISGHNQHFLWGPGSCSGQVMIVVGVPQQDLQDVFASITVGDTARCKYCMPYESNLAVLVCRGLKVPLRELWPRVRNYG
jgi:hypothetical protein